MMYVSTFDSGEGVGLVLAGERGIRAVLLPPVPQELPGGEKPQQGASSSPLTVRGAELLEAYFRGERPLLDDLPLELEGVTPFRLRVLKAVRGIPYGETRSYGQVAAAAGAPRAGRAVGGVLAWNPLPIIIPCHRVVAADGRLTGFSAPGGVELKKGLLRMESVEFVGERVVRIAAGYSQALPPLKKT